MVVADTSAEHFLLPIGVATLVVSVVDIVLRYIVTDIVGRSHIEGLRDFVECNIAIVADIRTLGLAAALGGDDDNTIGCLRTVDSGSGSIAEHIDRLDIIGSHH